MSGITGPSTLIPRVIGFAGWSGAGKTTLLARLIPELTGRGVRVSTIKHAHHAFDIDKPGKDSHIHREAGAAQVLVTGGQRWALMTELRGAPEPTLAELLAQLQPVDLVLVEGFKRDALPKLEVHRASNGKPWLFPEDPSIQAVLSDEALPADARFLPHAGLDDVAAAADLALRFAQPVAATGTAPWSS